MKGVGHVNGTVQQPTEYSSVSVSRACVYLVCRAFGVRVEVVLVAV